MALRTALRTRVGWTGDTYARKLLVSLVRNSVHCTCAHAQWSRASNETLLACSDGATASGGSLSLTLCQASRCCLQLPPDKVSMDDTVPST